MNLGSIKFAYWKYLSQPPQDRQLYRIIDQGHVQSITEIGVGLGQRAERMLAFALRHHAPHSIRYAGVDPFESRLDASTGLTLKQAYRHLNATGVHVRLIPGDILSALIRSANTLTKTDLVVINADVDHSLLEPSWFYFPRMLHSGSTVLLETGSVRKDYQPLSYTQVCELARKAASTVRRAA